MKQIAQNYKSGELAVLDVPAPICRPGGVLVRSLFSLISTGTEMMKVTEASMSMVGMARARPDQVRKVLDQVQQQGVVTTYKKVMNKLDSYTPLGLLAVRRRHRGRQGRRGVQGRPARRVRRQRAGAARRVQLGPGQPVRGRPRRRRARARRVRDRRGDRHAGRAARRGPARRDRGGHRPGPDRPARGPAAGRGRRSGGRHRPGGGPVPPRGEGGRRLAGSPDDLDIARRRAGGDHQRAAVADHIFLAAGGNSNGPVEAAVKLARDRARIVDIGKMKLDLPWNAYYEKELDVRFSRSYGPGRYDDRYELEGIDYPAGYVRWTEKRNLESFLELLARGSLEVATLIDGVFPFTDAAKVYGDLKDGSAQGHRGPAGVRAAGRRRSEAGHEQASCEATKPPAVRQKGTRSKSEVRSASSARETTPRPCCCRTWRAMGTANLAHVATTKSLSAVNAQKKFGFTTASTDYRRDLQRREPGRDLHRDQARDAREAGVPRAGDRQGGLRREAAGADPRGDRRDRRGDHQDRQRPADGRLQPAVRAAADRDAQGLRRGRRPPPTPGTWSTPGRWRRTAGTSTRRPRAPGSPARAATSSTR